MFLSIMTTRLGDIVRIIVIALLAMSLILSGTLKENYRHEHTLSCDSATAANLSGTIQTPSQLAAIIKPLAKLIAKDNPSLEEATRVLDGEEYIRRNNEILIDGHHYKIRIALLGNSKDSIEEISFYLSNNFGLHMKHITDTLGKTRPERYHATKTYFARYGYYNPNNKVLSYVIISTLTVPTDPKSPVTSIRIRRDEKPPLEILKKITPIIINETR